MNEITIIGPGRLGGALALALHHSGSKICQIVYRSHSAAKELAAKLDPRPSLIRLDKVKTLKTDVVLITVPDDEISNAVDAIIDTLENVKAVFHTSGSISSEILKPLRTKRCSIASLHPLASISSWRSGAKRFNGSFFCLEGDSAAVRIGKKIVSQLGGRSFTIASEQKPLYHAAALTAAGHVTALFDIAIRFMVESGVDRLTARKLLQPLLAGVAHNLGKEDTYRALTGTYARADEITMNRHLSALAEKATGNEFKVYLELALRSIDLAEKADADGAKLERMRRTLMVAKRKIEC